jgi:hypothetical protein
LRSAPWQYWHADYGIRFELYGLAEHTFEGCIMGGGGGEYGVALYDEKGARQAPQGRTARRSKANEMSRGSVRSGTRSCAEALQRVIGVPVLPVPMRLEHGRHGAVSGGEILALAAALVATSGLTP